LEYLLLLFIFKSFLKKSSFFSFGQFVFFIFYISSHYNLCLILCSTFFWFNIIVNWTNFTQRTYIVFTMKNYHSNLRGCWNVWISFFKGEINLYESLLQNGPVTALFTCEICGSHSSAVLFAIQWRQQAPSKRGNHVPVYTVTYRGELNLHKLTCSAVKFG
jgi:hypothetical protein